MLVFFNYPKGSTMIGGRRIYGYFENHSPVVVSWEVYRRYRSDLKPASYDKNILEALFPGAIFPDLSFTYYEIRHLSWGQMCSLCEALNITTNRSNRLRSRRLKEFFKENC